MYVCAVRWSDGVLTESEYASLSKLADCLYEDARAVEAVEQDIAEGREPDPTYCARYGMDSSPLAPARIVSVNIEWREGE